MRFSESIKQISKSIVAIQEELKNTAKTHTNPFMDNCTFAKLEDIINDVQPILFKNKLKLIQDVGGDGQSVTITSMLLHESGEWIMSEPLTLRNTENKKASISQEAGISITYARRYQLQGLLGINSEEDNDGNGGSPEKKQEEAKKPVGDKKTYSKPQQKKKPEADPNGKANKKQLEIIDKLVKNKGIEVKEILEASKIEKLEDLTVIQATQVIIDLQKKENKHE